MQFRNLLVKRTSNARRKRIIMQAQVSVASATTATIPPFRPENFRGNRFCASTKAPTEDELILMREAHDLACRLMPELFR